MLLQVRGARMATPLAVPACAWLIVEARECYLRTRGVPGLVALLGSWLVSAGVAVLLVVNFGALAIAQMMPGADGPPTATAASESNVCLQPSAFAALARLPPVRIMAPIDLGSHLLLLTPHSVVAAPYHRNQQGVRDAFDFFNRPIGEARRILDRRGISLVVICPQMAELKGLPEAAGDSFSHLYAAGRLPAWLVPIALAGTPLQAFRVMPATGG
jgi:hypothetical protein